MPQVAVNPGPRITTAASLYTLGPAYAVEPEKIERFLASRWSTISQLLADHGPWEGYNTARREPIRFQTSAHTFSLILGFLATGSDNMERYLASKNCHRCLEIVYPMGEPADLLSKGMQVYAWGDKGSEVRSSRQGGSFHVTAESARRVGVAFVAPRPEGNNLSGGLLKIRYRSAQSLPVRITLKPRAEAPDGVHRLPKEVLAELADTAGSEQEIEIPLPATPGLTEIKEVVLTWEEPEPRAIDLAIHQFAFSLP